ncbi:MAG: hypothetical protein COY40_03860 [Alphaproteobacteria bacterium CG_4_10_14_0_8_um_filter_53_9]|nr:MAG: hypothetical protein COY40_03860 [Alphaproteobacteria bacterium CG_4_10_14_0_8_um_filter_53_9]
MKDKNLSYKKIPFALGVLLALGISLGAWWLADLKNAETNVSEKIEALLQSNNNHVMAREMFPEPWTRLCLVPSNYNPISQSQLDHTLGQADLIKSSWLARDDYLVFAVLYDADGRSFVQKQENLALIDKDNIVCTSNREAMVTIGRYDWGGKTMLTSFEERIEAKIPVTP